MTNTILRMNAIPVYGFLSFIKAKQSLGELGEEIRILDCGAGGSVPPLALFAEQGFDAYGIDISDKQLSLAKQYCLDNGVQVDFRKGDMRQMPFDDESFDCVYEHYAMCHLSKKETASAIGEIHRVTRKNGLSFLGVISEDVWPKSFYGEKKEPGEYWIQEGGKLVRHSLFTDEEADQLVSEWEILRKEKNVICLRDAAARTSLSEWMEMAPCEASENEKDAWRDQYDQRANRFNYTHIYYFLRKRA